MRTQMIAVRTVMFMIGAPGAHAQGASTGGTQATGRPTQGGFRTRYACWASVVLCMGRAMKSIFITLAASVLLAGCVSGSGSNARPPNYVTTQATQSPAFRNDAFGGAAMPMRSLPR